MSPWSYNWLMMRNSCGKTSSWKMPRNWPLKMPKTLFHWDLTLRKHSFSLISRKNEQLMYWYQNTMSFFITDTLVGNSMRTWLTSWNMWPSIRSKESLASMTAPILAKLCFLLFKLPLPFLPLSPLSLGIRKMFPAWFLVQSTRILTSAWLGMLHLCWSTENHLSFIPPSSRPCK